MRSNAFVSLIACCAALVGVGAAPAATDESHLNSRTMCVNPGSRREWRTMSASDQAAYITAVNCLADKKRNPHSDLLTPSYPRSNIPNVTKDSSFYDDMTYIHMDLTDHIHYTGYFLPWHRWYLNTHFTQLKQKCGYKGQMPYWDWSKDADSFNTSAMWNADPNSGLGTFGDPNNDYYVTNGGFANMKVAYPITRGIRRQYSPFPYLTWWWVPRPTEGAAVGIQQSYIDDAVNGYVGDFVGFQNAMEKAQAFHANIHMIMGGDLAGTCPTAAGTSCIGGSTWTPSDPMFFLHHANIDRIWWQWQRKSPQNLSAFKGGSIGTYTDPAYTNGYPPWANTTDLLPTDGLFPQPTVASMMDTRTTDLCYAYV